MHRRAGSSTAGRAHRWGRPVRRHRSIAQVPPGVAGAVRDEDVLIALEPLACHRPWAGSTRPPSTRPAAAPGRSRRSAAGCSNQWNDWANVVRSALRPGPACGCRARARSGDRGSRAWAPAEHLLADVEQPPPGRRARPAAGWRSRCPRRQSSTSCPASGPAASSSASEEAVRDRTAWPRHTPRRPHRRQIRARALLLCAAYLLPFWPLRLRPGRTAARRHRAGRARWLHESFWSWAERIMSGGRSWRRRWPAATRSRR